MDILIVYTEKLSICSISLSLNLIGPLGCRLLGGMILLKIISSLFGKVRLIGYVCFNTNHNEDENSVSTYYMSIVTCFQQSTIRPSGDSGKGA